MQNVFDAIREFQQSVWRAVHLTADDHRLLFDHHRRIFEAIRTREPEAARDAMMVHLGFAEQRSEAFIARQR